MSTWQKIRLGLKFVFGSFEEASDYLLGLLNDYLGNTNVANRVRKAREYLASAISWLEKLAPYCPQKWAEDYAKLTDTVRFLDGVLADGKLSRAEVNAASEGVRVAIDKWAED